MAVQPNQAKSLGDGRSNLIRLAFQVFGAKGDVFGDREADDLGFGILEHQRAALDKRALSSHGLAGNADPAGDVSGRNQAFEAEAQRALASSRGAGDAHELAAVHRQVDARQGFTLAARIAEAESLDLDDAVAGGRIPRFAQTMLRPG